MVGADLARRARCDRVRASGRCGGDRRPVSGSRERPGATARSRPQRPRVLRTAFHDGSDAPDPLRSGERTPVGASWRARPSDVVTGECPPAARSVVRNGPLSAASDTSICNSLRRRRRRWKSRASRPFAAWSSIRLSSPARIGARKPIASETFDLLARRALEEGCRYFAYLNSDTTLSQEIVDRICAAMPMRMRSRAPTSVPGGRRRSLSRESIASAISAEWWTANRRRFRAYILGEPVWDSVYAAIAACHGRAEFVYETGALTHERHPTQWVASPFAAYVRYLSALDAPYFSLWCAYHDRLYGSRSSPRSSSRRSHRAGNVRLASVALWRTPIQASRCVKSWVRYVAGEAVAIDRVMRILLVGDFPDDPTLGSAKVLFKLREEFGRQGHRCDALFTGDIGVRPRQRHARDLKAPVLDGGRHRTRCSRPRGQYDVIDVAGAEGAAFAALRRSRNRVRPRS